MTGIYTKSIRIHGKSCEVVARKTGRNRWQATGDVDGQHIKIEGAYSAEYAIRDWQRQAETLTSMIQIRGAPIVD